VQKCKRKPKIVCSFHRHH